MPTASRTERIGTGVGSSTELKVPELPNRVVVPHQIIFTVNRAGSVAPDLGCLVGLHHQRDRAAPVAGEGRDLMREPGLWVAACPTATGTVVLEAAWDEIVGPQSFLILNETGQTLSFRVDLVYTLQRAATTLWTLIKQRTSIEAE